MRVRTLLAAVAVAATTTGCGGATSLDGVTLWRYGFMTGTPTALTGGTIDFSRGCVAIAPPNPAFDRQMVVWPSSTRLERVGGEVVLVTDGLRLQQGDEVSVGGGSYDAEQIEAVVGPIPPACVGDRYWLAGETKRGLP